jgi:quinol monooxygenase YgiN
LSNSDLIVMTPATARPGKEDAVYQALREVAEAARAQPGCVEYRIFRSAEEPVNSITFERWSSRQKRDGFLAGPDVKRFGAAVSGAFVQSPQPVSYQDVD